MAIIRRNNQNKDRSLTEYNPFISTWDDFFRFPNLLDDMGFSSNGRSMMADIWEEDEAVFIKTPLPGIDPDKVDISIDGDTLTIRGEEKEEQVEKDKKRNYYQKQLRYNEVYHSYTLPARVNADKAQASFENGMLTIKLPKSSESTPKKIKVSKK